MERSFVPAAGQAWALPLYDPIVRLIGAEKMQRRLLAYAGLQSGQRVLEIGCGTGTVTVLVKRSGPGCEVVGLDPDAAALARAEEKARAAGVEVRFDRGFSDTLPYPAGSFDRVLSSFMFHHLPPAEKVATLREARRVLRPEGALFVMDFGGKDLEPLAGMMRQAGFAEGKRLEGGRLLLGLLPYAVYAARGSSGPTAG
jgi:ubiquinone/menaquinone biosynthesis C-methylase UbiE